MMADPKKSESKAKTIAGQLQNRLPMGDRALGAASGLCTEAWCCISSLNHEIALFEIPAALRPQASVPREYRRLLMERPLGSTDRQGGPATRGLMMSIGASGRTRWQVPSPGR